MTTPEHGWTCFHCGNTFMDEGQARIHFGEDQGAIPGCVLRMQPGEHGLLRKMRELEKQLAEVTYQLFEQDSATDRYLANILTDHARNATLAEETGYAKGLRDAGAWRSRRIAEWAEDTFGPATALSTAIRALREMLELIELLAPLETHFTIASSINVMFRHAENCQKWEAAQRGELFTDVSLGPKVMEEVADVRIVLARIQRFFPGVLEDEQAQDAKMEINVKRIWKLDGHGHGQHVPHETFVGGVRMTVAEPCAECGSEKGHTAECSEGLPF